MATIRIVSTRMKMTTTTTIRMISIFLVCGPVNEPSLSTSSALSESRAYHLKKPRFLLPTDSRFSLLNSIGMIAYAYISRQYELLPIGT